jgi:hypothetical protein
MFKVDIIADSRNTTTNKRIITYQLKYPRFIHSELMTHRALSRNAMSSRAIPVEKMMADVIGAPAMPIHWGINQKGMQARNEASEGTIAKAIRIWEDAARAAVEHAERLKALNLHKQVVNRILEPFQWMQTIVTGTEWENFFGLRCHKDAQPEFRHLAEMMERARLYSKPQDLHPGFWHLPYIPEPELAESMTLRELLISSVARCARVSYRLHDGKQTNLSADKELFDQLTTACPMHASPLEHQAVALDNGYMSRENESIQRNFRGGWLQLRAFLEESTLPAVAEIYRPWPFARLGT